MSRPPRPSTYAALVADVCDRLQASVTTYSREHELLWPPRGGEPTAVQRGSHSEPTERASGVERYDTHGHKALPATDRHPDGDRQAIVGGDNRLMEKHLRKAASKVRYLERQAGELLDILTKGYDRRSGEYAKQQPKAARTPDAVSQRELDAQLDLKQRREAS